MMFVVVAACCSRMSHIFTFGASFSEEICRLSCLQNEYTPEITHAERPYIPRCRKLLHGLLQQLFCLCQSLLCPFPPRNQ